jgi:cytochrome P450
MLLQGDNLSRLTRAFEVLDPETSFQSLWSLASTIFTGKWRERRAIEQIDDVLTGIMRGRGDEVIDDNLNTLHEGFKQEFPGLSDRARSRLCAHTVFQFHLASQANLYAALSWTLVNLLTEPAAQASRVLEEHERLCRDFGSL